jgi:two-component system, chemotaxis family, response regulator Rcp1
MSNLLHGRPIEILLIEDNLGDIRLTQEALKEARVLNQMSVARDGAEALAVLRQEGEYAETSRPDIIFLDLNLPKQSGIEILAHIKSDETLKRIPVVIITSSRAEDDIIKSYNLHANCYVTKPIDLEQFIQVVKSIEGFWLTVVKLPPKAE